MNKKEEKINLFWKAREFKFYEKSTDWYWIFWSIIAFIIFINIYYFQDKIFSALIFLIGLVINISHLKTPKIMEYRLTNDSLIIENGKTKIKFEKILEYNIDKENGYILINTDNKYERIIRIPYENNQNIDVIDKILSTKIKKNDKLENPFLEKIFYRIIGIK